MTRLFVGNIGTHVTNQDLWNHFSPIGSIKKAFVATRDTWLLGYGFVDYEKPEDVLTAIEKLNQSILNERTIKVEIASLRPVRSVNGNVPAVAGTASTVQPVAGNEDGTKRRQRKRRPKRSQGQQYATNNTPPNPPAPQPISSPRTNLRSPPPTGPNPTNRNPNTTRTPNTKPINTNINKNYTNTNNSNTYNSRPPYNNYNSYNENNSGWIRKPNNIGNYNPDGYNNSYNNNRFDRRDPIRPQGRRGNQYDNNYNNNNYNNNNYSNNNSYNYNYPPRYPPAFPYPRPKITRPPPPSRPQVESKTTVYVSNLPFSVTDEELGSIFSEFKVRNAHVVVSRSGRSRGYGFVDFESEEDQQEAIRVKNNYKVGSGDKEREIMVKVSHSPGQVVQGGGGGGENQY